MNRRLRLRGRARFAAVRSGGVVGRDGLVRVRALPGMSGPSRAGFAVLATRSAVARNRMRRRLRAATAPLLPARPGMDVVVSARATKPEPAFTELVASIERALERALRRIEDEP